MARVYTAPHVELTHRLRPLRPESAVRILLRIAVIAAFFSLGFVYGDPVPPWETFPSTQIGPIEGEFPPPTIVCLGGCPARLAELERRGLAAPRPEAAAPSSAAPAAGEAAGPHPPRRSLE